MDERAAKNVGGGWVEYSLRLGCEYSDLFKTFVGEGASAFPKHQAVVQLSWLRGLIHLFVI